jgi:hypothetical protein
MRTTARTIVAFATLPPLCAPVVAGARGQAYPAIMASNPAGGLAERRQPAVRPDIKRSPSLTQDHRRG